MLAITVSLMIGVVAARLHNPGAWAAVAVLLALTLATAIVTAGVSLANLWIGAASILAFNLGLGTSAYIGFILSQRRAAA